MRTVTSFVTTLPPFTERLNIRIKSENSEEQREECQDSCCDLTISQKIFIHIPTCVPIVSSANEATDLNLLLYFVKMAAHTFREDNVMVDNGGLHGWTRALKKGNKDTQLTLLYRSFGLV